MLAIEVVREPPPGAVSLPTDILTKSVSSGVLSADAND